QITILPPLEKKSPEEMRLLFDKKAALANVPRIDGRTTGARRAPVRVASKPIERPVEKPAEQPAEQPEIAAKQPVREVPIERSESPPVAPPSNEVVASVETPPIGGKAGERTSAGAGSSGWSTADGDGLGLRGGIAEKATDKSDTQ